MFEDTFDLDSFDVEDYADHSWDNDDDIVGLLDENDCRELEAE